MSEEENCMCCLKNVSDDYSIYDDISFDDEIETIEEDKKIEKLDMYNIDDKAFEGLVKSINRLNRDIAEKINEIIDYINKEK